MIGDLVAHHQLEASLGHQVRGDRVCGVAEDHRLETGLGKSSSADVGVEPRAVFGNNGSPWQWTHVTDCSTPRLEIVRHRLARVAAMNLTADRITEGAAIEVRDLVKHYGDTKAVDGVSFAVDAGEVFAILGPNGAGKSTTVEILEGHRQRSSGDVAVLGLDPATAGRAFRDRIGVVLQEAGIDREFTVREVIDLYGAPYSTRRPTDELIELVELSEKADERVARLSGGQQRRVDLALGLVGDPEVIFLDEPTTGFDPAARRRSWDIVRNLTSLGKTVVLTTHYMEEAEQLADRILVLARGSIVAEGTAAELRSGLDTDSKITFGLPAVDEPLAALLDPLVGTSRGRDRRLEILTPAPTADLAHITAWATARGLELESLTVSSIDLEDVYLQLVGEPEVEA